MVSATSAPNQNLVTLGHPKNMIDSSDPCSTTSATKCAVPWLSSKSIGSVPLDAKVKKSTDASPRRATLEAQMHKIPSRQRVTISSVAEDFSTCDSMLTKETRVATWNVNSIRKRIKNSQFYAIFDCDTDILVLTEIRCKVDQLFSYEDFWSVLETRGYRYCAWHSARDGVLKHGYAGVAILSKLAPISFIFGFQNDEDTEGRVLTIRFRDALLIGAYCPARPECMQHFLESLKNHNQLLKEKLGLPIFLVGDINMIGAKSDAIEHSIPYPNATQMCQDYFNTLIGSMNLSDSALIPNSNSAYDAVDSSKNVTWYERPHRPKFGMRIDYILVPHQFSSLVRNYARLAVIGSDHLPIICTILSESGEKAICLIV